MGESYSDGKQAGAADAIALIARLIPSANADLLVTALQAEAAAPSSDAGLSPPPLHDGVPTAPERELRRVRKQLALGEAAKTVQHAMNNPLTALMAEAQLLELEPLASDQLLAVGRMIELARRIAKVVRRLDGSEPARLG